MSDKTKIEWADATWNIVTGCTRVSPGCENCYIDWAPPTGVRLHPERLDQPLRWHKPRRVFVNSLSDLFHEGIPDDYIARVWAVMTLAPNHTFQILTKRHARMRSLLDRVDFWQRVGAHMSEMLDVPTQVDDVRALPNVWLGVTVEDQQRANLRIPYLAGTPAAVRFLSCEPLIGRVDLSEWIGQGRRFRPFDWVIVGGESGKDARPMHPDWARLLRDQCIGDEVPFFFKQRGEWSWNEPGEFRVPPKPYTDRTAVMHPAGMTAMRKGNGFNPFERGHPDWATRITRVGKRAAGRELDGRTWDEFPEVTR